MGPAGKRKHDIGKPRCALRWRMTLFLDTHKGTSLPDDLRRTVESRVKSGAKDAYGVVDRGIVIDDEAGEMHCVLEAPTTQAIVDHHRALNVPLENSTIHRASAILK